MKNIRPWEKFPLMFTMKAFIVKQSTLFCQCLPQCNSTHSISVLLHIVDGIAELNKS